MSERAFKLLETASRSTTPEGERIAAMNALGRLSARAGSFRDLFGHGEDAYPALKQRNSALRLEIIDKSDEIAVLERSLQRLSEENHQHRETISELKTQNAKFGRILDRVAVAMNDHDLEAPEKPVRRDYRDGSPSVSLDPEIALHGALNREWQLIGRIANRARDRGFEGVDNTIRKRLVKLTQAGKIAHQIQGGLSYWRLA